MKANLTEKTEYDNITLFILGGCVIVTNIILDFVESDIFKIFNFIAVFATLFTFAWFKLILVDQYVHSFWLKKRMRKSFKCIYGYGVDEYFVLARLNVLTSILVLAFVILNGVDVVSGVFSPWSVVVEGVVSGVFICIYCMQLRKYDSAFGFSQVIVPFVSSCIGLLVTSMFVWHSVSLAVLFLFFAFTFVVCMNEIMSIGKTLEWGDHAIVCLDDEILDSKELQFYLIFYSENDIEIWWTEDKNFKHRKVDEIKSIERFSRLSNRINGVKDSTPVWIRVVEWIMGLRIFR